MLIIDPPATAGGTDLDLRPVPEFRDKVMSGKKSDVMFSEY